MGAENILGVDEVGWDDEWDCEEELEERNPTIEVDHINVLFTQSLLLVHRRQTHGNTTNRQSFKNIDI